jgi:hypothetical protein
MCIEFLKEYYTDFFDYSFTRRVEEVLDEIKNDSKNWNHICKLVLEKIEESTKNVYEKKRGCGNVLIPNLKIENKKLKRNEYSVHDLTEYNNSFIGDYNKKPINLMNGKYGPYLKHNSINYKINTTAISLDEAIKTIDRGGAEPNIIVSKNVLRNIDNNISIRNGNNGKPYIYYNTQNIPKPLFFNIKNVDLLSCESSVIISFVKKSIFDSKQK